MLFNSFEFLFVFLPITLVGFFTLGATERPRLALAWLLAASLAFYGFWNASYVWLLVASITGNFLFGRWLDARRTKGVLALAVGANLALLGYYKYAGFFLENVNALLGTGYAWKVLLPLGISFFTLTQVAFLFDVYRGKPASRQFIPYALFVSFFPHLLAGPILHHQETTTQFERPATFRLSLRNVAVGLTLLVVGLFKKVVIADGLIKYSQPVFEAASAGASLTLVEAWAGMVAFAFQLYFDFAGYSEVALGLALMLNVRLPINFFSPWKARSLVEIWSRWHISLWRFFKDYYYLPLARRDRHRHPAHRFKHLVSTLLLSGLWHGASWTFLIWGALNGLALALDRAWAALKRTIGLRGRMATITDRLMLASVFLVAGVFFRSPDLATAAAVFRGLAGLSGLDGPVNAWTFEAMAAPIGQPGRSLMPTMPLEDPLVMGAWLAALFALCLFSPNVIELMARYRVGLGLARLRRLSDYRGRLHWRPTPVWGVVVGLMAGFAIAHLSRVTEFMYFAF